MNRFQRSWYLLKSSLSVVNRNKRLLVFPMITFISSLTLIVFFLGPPLFRPTGYSYLSTQHWQAINDSLFTHPANSSDGDQSVVFSRAAMIYMGFLYFVGMFVATFSNVAFYHEIMAALSGQPVSIGRGISFAFSRLGSILMWTLFAGVVGFIIKTIEERLSLVGQLVGKLIGLAWSVASVFVIPVIVREEKNANPFTVLQRSAVVLKRTWGEALIGYAGLGFANVMILLLSIVWLIMAAVVSSAIHNFWLLGVAGVMWFFALCLWSYVAGVASHVYRGALYIYAADGIVAAPYNQEMLEMAWKFRKR